MKTPTTRQWLAAALASTFLLAGAGTVQLAQASPHGHRHHAEGPEMGMGRGMDRMLDVVNATDAQRAQIRQIHEAARADMKAQREAARATRQQMRALFAQPTVDANAVEVLRQQMLAQHDVRSQRMMQAMVETSRVLTPEQRQQIHELMNKREERMQQRRGDRQGGPRSAG